MNNKVLFIRYISVVIGVWLLLAGCKTGIDVDNLPLPESILEDASASLVKSDQTGVNKDCAEVDPAALVPDFTNADETDAGRVLNLVKGKQILVYIELPSSELKIDHILRILSAASIKLALNQVNQSLRVLNTKLMQERVANLGLNDVQAKAYALSVAKKINDKALEHDVIIVDLDELSVTPKEFFQVLTKPNIIAVSRKNIDKFEAFSGDILKQFTPSGLNPGHVFQITKSHFKRWETKIDPAAMRDLVLKATKIISALEPNTSLGSLAKIYMLLDSVIDKDPTSSSLEADVMSTLAGYFQTNSKYVASIELYRRTLSDIYDKTKQNPLAFSEQERKLDKVFKMTAGIKGAMVPGINTQAIVDDARDQISRDTGDKIEAMGHNIESRVKEAVARIVDTSTKLAQDVKGSTEAVVKTEHRLTKQEVALAQEEVKKIVTEESERVLGDIARLPGKNRAQVAVLSRALYRAFYETLVQYIKTNLELKGDNSIGEKNAAMATVLSNAFLNRLERINRAPRADISIQDTESSSNNFDEVLNEFRESLKTMMEILEDKAN